ncbi:coiled-coil domain-containing protein 42 homolog [Tubulanus polymorphus]|uniref:coiled-coil domain-containing protein 42 homolog n=1 Tax=Tubulanus polymorphus TaxID=672921 RepID=UPI003DA5EBC6
MNISLEDYFRTTFEDRLLVKMPERDDDNLTAATKLLEKRREMAEVEQALKTQQEEFQMKMESLGQRREELERKEFLLKESLLKFDKFLKENDSKRARAVKKADDEKDLKRSKVNEITRLKDSISELVKEKDDLLQTLNANAIFQQYMDRMIETTEEFHEIREVIARYDTLTVTHKDLMEKEIKNQEAIETERQEFKTDMEEVNNEILNYNNELAALQTRLDKAESRAVKWESKWTHIKNTAAHKTLVLGRIKMATHNLYQLVLHHHHRESESTIEDTTEQLNKIKQFILDLTHIISEIRRNIQAATQQHHPAPAAIP